MNLADEERLIAATVGMIEEGTPMRRSELLTRVSAATCSAQRRADVTALVDAGRINSPDVLRFTLTSSDKAFEAFCRELGVEASKRGKGGSQPMAEPDEDDEDETDEATLSKIGALAGLTATADGTKQISAKKLRKALAEKRAETCDVDTSSLKRNGLADDYDAAKKRAHAPQPLGTATRADPRALSVEQNAARDEMARVTSSLAEYRNPTSPKK